MRTDLRRPVVTAISLAVFLGFSVAAAFAQGNPEPPGVNPAGGGVPMRSLEKLKSKSAGPAARRRWQAGPLRTLGSGTQVHG